MRTVLIRLTIPIVVCLLLAMPMFAQAQAAQANLVAWAALPAQTLADGSSAGQKLGAKTTNKRSATATPNLPPKANSPTRVCGLRFQAQLVHHQEAPPVENLEYCNF